MVLSDLTSLVEQEIRRGRIKHGPVLSHHDGWARLFGEVEELTQAVLHDRSCERTNNIRAEAVQVAAMAIRLVLETDRGA